MNEKRTLHNVLKEPDFIIQGIPGGFSIILTKAVHGSHLIPTQLPGVLKGISNSFC